MPLTFTSEKLLNNPTTSDKQLAEISKEDSRVIHIAGNLIPSAGTCRDSVWIKNNGPLFDTKMGSHDGAEAHGLAGLPILHQPSQLVAIKNTGLHSNDSPASFLVGRVFGPKGCWGHPSPLEWTGGLTGGLWSFVVDCFAEFACLSYWDWTWKDLLICI